jgi:PhnB protein
MSVTAAAHLNFHGQAREALEFYASVFEGTTMIATYGQFGMPPEAPDAGKVMFGQVTSENGFRVLAYDVPGQPGPIATPTPTNSVPVARRENGLTLTTATFFLSAQSQTVEEATGYWNRLAGGADVIEPLGPVAWGPAFGMLTDRFGVTWIVDVAAAQ